MVEIKGLEKFSPKDFPGHISSTVFLGGCNFRCPYCHNADLVLKPESYQTLPMEFFMSHLDARKGWLEGVCISGGEPLMDEEVETLARVVKERGLLVKIDTNGAFPDRLESLLKAGLIDWVAIDVKSPLERYPEVTRSSVRAEDIQRSVDIVRGSRLRSIFRTTVVPGLVGKEDLVGIGEWLRGAEIFQIQQFVPHDTIDPEFLKVQPYSREELLDFAEAIKPFFRDVRLEGQP